jgi:transposase
MLTRYKGQLKLKDWAFAIAKRSTMRKARVALARRLRRHECWLSSLNATA